MRAARFAILATFLGTILSGCKSEPGDGPVLVGHLTPGEVGERTRRGVSLAVRRANADGIGGRRVEVRHATLGAGATAAADETVRLLAVNRVGALLASADSAQSDQIARAALPYGASLVASAPLLAPAPENAVSTAPAPAARGTTLARFAAEELKARRAVLLVDRRQPLRAAEAAAFEKQFASEKDARAESWAYDSEATLAEAVARLAKARPDVVFVAGSAADLARVRAAPPAAPAPALLFGGEAAGDGEAGAGVYTLTTFVVDDSLPEAKSFAEEYRKEFREEPDAHAASAYEGARLLFEVMRRASAARAERLRDVFPTFDGLEGLAGRLAYRRDDPHASRPTFVVTREGAQTKLVKRYDPKPK